MNTIPNTATITNILHKAKVTSKHGMAEAGGGSQERVGMDSITEDLARIKVVAKVLQQEIMRILSSKKLEQPSVQMNQQ